MVRIVPKPAWISLVLALAYGLIMVSLRGPLLGDSDGSPDWHDEQAEALMQGHMYLSTSIEDMESGLAWHDGQIQQVWGLGVAIWLLPFKVVWELALRRPFPTDLAIGGAFSGLALLTVSTALVLIRDGRSRIGLGLMWIILLSPPLWTLTRVSNFVFEETVLYAVILSLAILVALIRIVLFGGLPNFWLSTSLSAFAVWIRPTHAIYGLIAFLLAAMLLCLRNRSTKHILLGIALWFASLSAQAWTNWVRFGSPCEFGHRMTVSTDSMVYLTRFDNPYRETSLPDASTELLAALFLAPIEAQHTVFDPELLPGQAAQTRWRHFTFSTFDPSYLLFVLGGLAAGITVTVRQWRKTGTGGGCLALVSTLFAWWGTSTAALFVFYLYYPVLTSRYILDFLPAFAAGILFTWIIISRKAPVFCCILLAGWTIYGLATTEVTLGEDGNPVPPEERIPPDARGASGIASFDGRYTLLDHPSQTGIIGNGSGWIPITGVADYVISLAVDAPQFVQLEVSARLHQERAGEDDYRAMIDGIELPLDRIREAGDRLDIVFDVPEEVRSRAGIEWLFLCFTDSLDWEDRYSRRRLHSVEWR